MLQIIKYNDLDDPKNVIDTDVMYKNIPFFNDYYITVHLKKLFVTLETQYVPIIFEDIDLQDYYHLNNLENHASKILGSFEKIFSPILKIQVYLLELKDNAPTEIYTTESFKTISNLPPEENKKYVMYIVKKHIWKVFTYTCVITIFCDNINVLNKYFEIYFMPGIKKIKFKKNI